MATIISIMVPMPTDMIISPSLSQLISISVWGYINRYHTLTNIVTLEVIHTVLVDRRSISFSCRTNDVILCRISVDYNLRLSSTVRKKEETPFCCERAVIYICSLVPNTISRHYMILILIFDPRDPRRSKIFFLFRLGFDLHNS